jgi:hypothetical protein
METNKTQTEQLTQDIVMQSVLKASHLRIGNILYIPQLKDNFEIGAIYENGRFLTKNNKHSFSSVECAKPIPLTEEWKTKLFSWFTIDYRIEWKNNRLHLYLNENYVATCDYLHEYQNLHFALTQRELTIA